MKGPYSMLNSSELQNIFNAIHIQSLWEETVVPEGGELSSIDVEPPSDEERSCEAVAVGLAGTIFHLCYPCD